MQTMRHQLILYVITCLIQINQKLILLPRLIIQRMQQIRHIHRPYKRLQHLLHTLLIQAKTSRMKRKQTIHAHHIMTRVITNQMLNIEQIHLILREKLIQPKAHHLPRHLLQRRQLAQTMAHHTRNLIQIMQRIRRKQHLSFYITQLHHSPQLLQQKHPRQNVHIKRLPRLPPVMNHLLILKQPLIRHLIQIRLKNTTCLLRRHTQQKCQPLQIYWLHCKTLLSILVTQTGWFCSHFLIQ